jgi:hypothetical protein
MLVQTTVGREDGAVRLDHAEHIQILLWKARRAVGNLYKNPFSRSEPLKEQAPYYRCINYGVTSSMSLHSTIFRTLFKGYKS